MTTDNDNHDMENLLRESTEGEVPPEVQARLRRRLSDFRKQMEQAETPRKENIIMIIMRKAQSGRIKWVAAAVIAILVGLVVFGLNPWNDGLARSYAAVVQQIRNARTMTYKITTTPVMEGMPPMTIEMMYKEPGFLRMNMPMGGFLVLNGIEKKGISVIGPTKQFVEQDFSNLPPDQVQKQTNYIDEMRALPDQADEVLGEKEMDGRIVRGFHVLGSRAGKGLPDGSDMTVWVDAETGDLVCIEGEFMNAKGVHVTMKDFQFDVELADSLFSTTPPEGYKPLNVPMDFSAPDEKDLIKFLRYYAEGLKAMGLKDVTFPPAPNNPVEFIKHLRSLKKEGKLIDKEMTKDESQQMTFEMTRGVMFIVQMKPENDWHYAGEGVHLGDADTPICWWKPSGKNGAPALGGEPKPGGYQVWRPGAETYRVVYGDLSVRDVAPENLPSH